MKTTRQGLMGNFVSLHEVVKAVADRIAISDEEADLCRGPNRLRAESAFEVQIVRSQIKSAMAQSRAAGVLLEPLNRPAAQRPAWYDSTPGYPKLKDAVSDRGMDILIDLSGSEARLRRRERLPQQVESHAGDQALLPAHSIGFEIDELISHLKSAKVPHSLKLRGQTRRRSPAPEPAFMMGESVVITPLAPQYPVGLKESESLTDYLSRTMPPPLVFVDRLDDQLESPNDVNLVGAIAGDTLSDEESSAERQSQGHPVEASLADEVLLEAAWQKFEAWQRRSRSYAVNERRPCHHDSGRVGSAQAAARSMRQGSSAA
ncbi:MAG: hypothetical protein ABIR54_01385 [Burkholderiaceae bacterium]